MKKTIFSAGVVVLSVALLLISVSQFRSREAEQNRVAEAAKAESVAQVALLEQRVAVATEAYNKERVECEKGAGAYNLLLYVQPFETAPKPTCGPAVLQLP